MHKKNIGKLAKQYVADQEQVIRRTRKKTRRKLSLLKWTILMAGANKKYPILSTILMCTAIIFVWRGVWLLIDEFFLPSYPLLSGVLSIALGVGYLLLDDFELKELKD